MKYNASVHIKWFGFYSAESRQKKNLFALIVIGKNTASLCFRVNPDTFDDNNVRTVKGLMIEGSESSEGYREYFLI